MPVSLDAQRRLLTSAKRAEDLARQIATAAGRDAQAGNDEAAERARRARMIVHRAEELRLQMEARLARTEAAFMQACSATPLPRPAD